MKKSHVVLILIGLLVALALIGYSAQGLDINSNPLERIFAGISHELSGVGDNIAHMFKNFGSQFGLEP